MRGRCLTLRTGLRLPQVQVMAIVPRSFFIPPLNLILNLDKMKHLFTPKEREIILLIIDGDSYKMIAVKCKTEISTIRTHVKNIHNKSKTHNTAQLIKYAYDNGLHK